MSQPDFTETLTVPAIWADHSVLDHARRRMTDQGATWFEVTHLDQRTIRINGWKVRPE